MRAAPAKFLAVDFLWKVKLANDYLSLRWCMSLTVSFSTERGHQPWYHSD